VLCSICNLNADVLKNRPSVQFKDIVIQEQSGFRKGRSFTDLGFYLTAYHKFKDFNFLRMQRLLIIKKNKMEFNIYANFASA
jgi:hypothetical protein